MKISLIGMAGTGKTYWSKKLAERGFKRYCCDDLIEAKLGDELKKLGYSGLADMSRWLGQPYDQTYFTNSRRYLGLEQEVVEEIVTHLADASDHEDIVVDTTGSVIYTDRSIIKLLKKHTRIIYLETPQSVQNEMYRLYLREPRPVIWGEAFRKSNGESDHEALARCYPELLAWRTKHYQDLSDKKLDYYKLRQKDFDIEQFISVITR